MDVWKRHGVPFWYPNGMRNVRVAGRDWRPPDPGDVASGADVGGVAHADLQQPGNGAIANANDANIGTYWYSGDGVPHGKLWIEFPRPVRLHAVRFLGWATPRHAPKDYVVGLIAPDGAWQPVASVADEKRTGRWIEFPVANAVAKGVYLNVHRTMEGNTGR